MELTLSFDSSLQEFRPVFTEPSFRLFVHLLSGWALSCRHLYITKCIFTSRHVGDGHWSRYHRYFSQAAWSLDTLCMLLARLLVSWGHDWVVLALLVPLLKWAPTKVFALPVGFRLYKSRQGLTKGKKQPFQKGKG